MSGNAVRELQRHIKHLRAVGYWQYRDQLAYMRSFLKATPVFSVMIQQLFANVADFSAERWAGEHVFPTRQARHRWPPNELQKFAVLWYIIEAALEDEKPTVVVGLGQTLSGKSNFDVAVQTVTQEVVAPLCDWLLSRLGTESAMLHLLGRFKRQVEWFEQSELHAKYTADTKHGEHIYDRRLREFLFNSGIDYPFSGPASASGWADVVAALDGDDPLVCEIKLFDGGDYGVPCLAKGLKQALRYARDYGKPVGHLVIVNLSDKRLSLPTDGEPGDDHPPRVVSENTTIFMTVVDGKPRPSASKEGKVDTVEVGRERLVRVDSFGGVDVADR